MFLSQKKKKSQPGVIDLMQLTRSPRLARLSNGSFAGHRLLFRVLIDTGWLVCGAPSTYVEG